MAPPHGYAKWLRQMATVLGQAEAQHAKAAEEMAAGRETAAKTDAEQAGRPGRSPRIASAVHDARDLAAPSHASSLGPLSISTRSPRRPRAGAAARAAAASCARGGGEGGGGAE